jgi:hypothetical protein
MLENYLASALINYFVDLAVKAFLSRLWRVSRPHLSRLWRVSLAALHKGPRVDLDEHHLDGERAASKGAPLYLPR